MNEDVIVEKLAAQAPENSFSDVPRNIPEPQGDKTPQPESGIEPKEPENPFECAYNKQQLLQHFNIQPKFGDKSDEYINNILDFAKTETQSKDISIILSYINQIERQIGNTLKPNRLQRFQQFVTIRTQARYLEHQLSPAQPAPRI